MTLHIVSDALQERVTAHLSQFGTLARPVLWTGKGSIVVHFAEPMNVTATDTRFAPLLLNWSATFRSPDGAVYLNVPAAWRRAEPEGEVDTMPMYLSLSEPQQKALRAIHGGDPFVNVPQGTLKALFEDGWIVGLKEGGRILPPLQLTPAAETMLYEYDVMRLNKTKNFKTGQAVQYLRWNGNNGGFAFEWVDATVTNVGKEMLTLDYADGTTGTRRAVSVREKPAIIEPTAPIPVNELENADEPHDDIGTLVSDEAPLTVPDQTVVDPYAWATPAKRAALDALVARKHVYPQILEPSTMPDVWRMEDQWKVKTMERTIDKLGGTLVGELEQDWDGDEPYCIALFKLEVDGRPNYEPFPSGRPSKPAADPNSIHAQYDALHDTLPAATQLFIQANGDEWLAFQMDAMLLRRYAPLCRFAAQTVNNAGEQWDKLSIPAGLLDETVTNANEGGLTVALASIVRDEPGKLPIREVTEIHRPNEPIQYLGKEEPPTEWETEADAEAQPELNNFVSALIRTYFEPAALEPTSEAPQSIPAPSALVMTPELQAAKIRLHIHGGLRLGRLGICRQLDRHEIPGQWFDVFFIHPIKPYIVEALEADYDIERASGHIVTLRPKQAAPIGDVQVQADAVVSAFSNASAAVETLATAFTDAQARMDEFTGAAQAADGPELLDEADEADLIEVLRLEHADIAEAALGVTQFLLNVIARLRTTATVAAPY